MYITPLASPPFARFALPLFRPAAPPPLALLPFRPLALPPRCPLVLSTFKPSCPFDLLPFRPLCMRAYLKDIARTRIIHTCRGACTECAHMHNHNVMHARACVRPCRVRIHASKNPGSRNIGGLYMCTCVYIYIYMYKHIYIHTYTSIHIHIHIHACVYIYIYILCPS